MIYGIILAGILLLWWVVTAFLHWRHNRTRMAIDLRPADPTLRLRATTRRDGYRYEIQKDK